MGYVFLSLAIISEVAATSLLKVTKQFTKLVPSIIVVAGYIGSFYLFALSLKTIRLGIAYAIWSGVGITIVTIAGFLFYREKIDLPAIIGIVLIITGVLVINLLSNTVKQ